MIKTIIGLFILIIPFLLVSKFKNKKIGFLYIFSFLLFFHLIVAILTQMFHIFTYSMILTINLLICAIVILKTNFRELKGQLKGIKIDWILIFIIIVLFIHLFSVHYNYTGKITTINKDYIEVKNMKYVYPYFADEWYAISLVNYSIESNSLPLVNPLNYDKILFVNFEFPFHSFISEIILLLDLNPLTQYTLLTIFSGMIICLLVYLFLRFNNIRKLLAAIISLSVLYITNGANLPGIWNLVPLTMGIIAILLGFLFIDIHDKKMIFLTAFLVLFFYPPLFLFYTVYLLTYLSFSKSFYKREKIILSSLYLILSILVATILFIFAYSTLPSFSDSIHHTYSKIIYPSFTGKFIPQFSIFYIIPIPILILSVFGLIKVIRRKVWLIASVFLGLIFWLFYSFTGYIFIIEYARVVVFTSILIVLVAGFGLDYLVEHLNKIKFFRKYHILKFIQIGILITLLFFSFSYTKRENWMNLKMVNYKTNGFSMPAAPANNYLHPDDLKLFGDIKNKVFLSPSWKGTVIGVATNNYPLSTKPGTITIGRTKFSEFMNANCDEKIKMKIQQNYVYAPSFNCSGFELKGVSEEGLHLYEVIYDPE